MKRDKQTVDMFATIEPVTLINTKAEHVTYYPTPPDDTDEFTALLERYASGVECREAIITAIWPWDDPLQRMIIAAMDAAERHGRWKEKNF